MAPAAASAPGSVSSHQARGIGSAGFAGRTARLATEPLAEAMEGGDDEDRQGRHVLELVQQLGGEALVEAHEERPIALPGQPASLGRGEHRLSAAGRPHDLQPPRAAVLVEDPLLVTRRLEQGRAVVLDASADQADAARARRRGARRRNACPPRPAGRSALRRRPSRRRRPRWRRRAAVGVSSAVASMTIWRGASGPSRTCPRGRLARSAFGRATACPAWGGRPAGQSGSAVSLPTRACLLSSACRNGERFSCRSPIHQRPWASLRGSPPLTSTTSRPSSGWATTRSASPS